MAVVQTGVQTLVGNIIKARGGAPGCIKIAPLGLVGATPLSLFWFLKKFRFAVLLPENLFPS
ncbi:MAG: hypothetical protein DRR08_26600 [Candidatus Parabeggiatoa sp. nov. 2]|nr:MAG: hypothetical protein DRR08_26600 [Gammaproteobacteria bacterium]